MFAIEIRVLDCSFNQAVHSGDLILGFALDHKLGSSTVYLQRTNPERTLREQTEEHYADDIKPVSSYKIGKEVISSVCVEKGDTRYTYI